MEKYYKTELHAHTKPVSRCSDIDAKRLVEIYKEKGYDSIVLTNHFIVQLQGKTVEEKIKWYLEDYYKCVEAGKVLGLNIILGAELRFTENNNDYLIFTVPVVLLITMKYSLAIEGESDGDPVEVLLHDKVLLALCVLYLAIMFMILYL